LLALLLLGGRQMGLAVLMHETAHRSFFASNRLNDWLGRWLTAAPLNLPMDAYRDIHLRHHRYAGSDRDPDLVLIRGYPAKPASLARKFMRDVFGLTAIKDLTVQAKRATLRSLAPTVAVNAAMAVGLWLCGIGWTYLLWIAAYLFVYPMIIRLRLMGEHGSARAATDPDVRNNTTTVSAGPFEKLFIAPNGVHFHLEHHLLASVPIYRLGAMHRLLDSRGFFAGADCVRRSYVEVISRCMAADGKSHVAPA
jgi:fatty acid desaturase